MIKLGISGNGECGKDTVAVWLALHTPIRYTASTSAYAAEEVFDLFQLASPGRYKTVEECYTDRRNHRVFWADAIDAINERDPAYLYRKCLADQDLLTGVRKRREFEAVRAAGLVDAFIWIERKGPPDCTQQYGAQDCDFTIENNGSLEDLYDKLKRLVRLFKLSDL